eukprot:1151509-Pelagomonas_calceolata.AAC.3
MDVNTHLALHVQLAAWRNCPVCPSQSAAAKSRACNECIQPYTACYMENTCPNMETLSSAHASLYCRGTEGQSMVGSTKIWKQCPRCFGPQHDLLSPGTAALQRVEAPRRVKPLKPSCRVHTSLQLSRWSEQHAEWTC